jgi:hypothetical protein
LPDEKWHSHVSIERRQYLALKAWFAELATRQSAKGLAVAFYQLPVVPYAPVRRQLLMMLREVNRVRKKSGKVPVAVNGWSEMAGWLVFSAFRYWRKRVIMMGGLELA